MWWIFVQTKRKSVTPTAVVRPVEAGRMSEGMSMFVDSAHAPKEKEVSNSAHLSLLWY
jgi:hypothetical protein